MQVVIGRAELGRLMSRVRAAADKDLTPLLDGVGAAVESAARRRVRATKRGPDGRRWAAWSERYAHGQADHESLLESTGALGDSLTYVVGRTSVVVGSPLVYAAVHQFGDAARNIPARPFLDADLDDANTRDELRRVARAWLGGLLG